MADDRSIWPLDKASTLRLGRRLAAEVPSSGTARRAFVSITPSKAPVDEYARREGWVHSDHGRSFRVEHWEYDADRIDGFDYDVGAMLMRSALAVDESQLLAVLRLWRLSPGQFRYAWETDDPR
ncbi:hypothetical protein [Cryptosporangium minutisporangium]